MKIKPNDIDRFWSKVDVKGPNDCWTIPTVKGNRDGYKPFVLYDKGRKYRLAHRVSAAIAGYDIEGKLVCHHCDNPACVNPNHLFVGTNLDNMRDKVNKGRQSKGPEHQQRTKEGMRRWRASQ